MRIILSLILSIYVCPVFATPEAEVHIQAMLDKYQSLNIYEDYGVTHIRYIKSDGSGFTNEDKFTTKYIENESLHFQWARQPNEIEKKIGGDLAQQKVYKVWKDATEVFTKYPFQAKSEKHANLANALSSATGISSGLAWMVPRYLTPDISCKPNLGAKTSEVLKSDENTIIIKLLHKTGSTSKLFIDKRTHLLKKYENTNDLGNGTVTQQATVYNVINTK